MTKLWIQNGHEVYSIIHSFNHSKLKNQGALVTIKCSKRISRCGRRNDNFWKIWVFFSGLKNENTWGVKTKSFAKSNTAGAETCITESSETEHWLDSFVSLDCSVLAFWIAWTRICEAENVLPKTVNINISDIIKTLNKRAIWDDFCILNDKSSTFLSIMPNSVPKFCKVSFKISKLFLNNSYFWATNLLKSWK